MCDTGGRYCEMKWKPDGIQCNLLKAKKKSELLFCASKATEISRSFHECDCFGCWFRDSLWHSLHFIISKLFVLITPMNKNSIRHSVAFDMNAARKCYKNTVKNEAKPLTIIWEYFVFELGFILFIFFFRFLKCQSGCYLSQTRRYAHGWCKMKTSNFLMDFGWII